MMATAVAFMKPYMSLAQVSMLAIVGIVVVSVLRGLIRNKDSVPIGARSLPGPKGALRVLFVVAPGETHPT